MRDCEGGKKKSMFKSGSLTLSVMIEYAAVAIVTSPYIAMYR